MNGIARAPQRVPEVTARNNKAKELAESTKTRVFIQADTLFLQERLARALGGEKSFETIVHAGGEVKRNGNTNGREKEILVMFSSGLVLEDLHRVQGWRIALPALRVLLLGASQQEGDFLQYVRSGIRGFLP